MIQIKINNKIVGIYQDQMLQTTDRLFTALKLHITEDWKEINVKKVAENVKIDTNSRT